MRGGVDAACEAGGDHQAVLSEFGGDRLREFSPQRRGVARADHGHHLAREQRHMSGGEEQRRRRVERGEALRESGISGEQHVAAERGERIELALRLGVAGNAQPIRAAAAPRHVGQGAQRGSGRAEARDQIGEGDGADILRARKAQPGAPFRLAAHAAHPGLADFCPIRGSVPASSRAMFSRCMIQMRMASAAASVA